MPMSALRSTPQAISFTVERCKTKAGYSARLSREMKLDLDAVAGKFKVLLRTPLLLVLNTEEGEVIVHGYGELLFKEGRELTAMKKIAAEIYGSGLNAAGRAVPIATC